MAVCLIGLGSNSGNRQALLAAAVSRLRECPQIKVLDCSAWRETAPVGGPSGQLCFLNGALTLETSLSPRQLLAQLIGIEHQLGRRRAERWGARTIDLDLLLYDDLVLDEPELVVPHPRMAWRRFVLEPAAEVAGAMLHPIIHWSVAELQSHLAASARYVAIAGPIAVGKTHLAERLVAAIGGQWIAEEPNCRELDDFYADPNRHGLATELAFLQERAQRLTAAAFPKPGSPWTISDFWFDQSAAFARAWLSAEPWRIFSQAYERVRPNVVRPRLVILLDLPGEELLANLRRRGRPCERHLLVEQLERIRESLKQQASRPDVGPVLRARGDDRESLFTEALAAIQAME